ncbi:MAG: type II toxin-antitoxin system RelE/ParE family toxin [Myxococcales bacterium]|nr:type II toxin-antitoxin system RelE/ParE family toxin [Myxococcales bacterium]
MISKPLVWTDRALEDLEEIDAYIAADDPIAAEQWVEGLLVTARRAGELPMSGRVVPELGREDIRELLKRTRLRVVTNHTAEGIDEQPR